MSFFVPSSRAVLVPALAATLLLSACAATAQPPTETPATVQESAPQLQVTDAWIKAADGGMTSAFANLHNVSNERITLSGAASTVAQDIELHEMTGSAGATSMQELTGGIVIEPGAEIKLAPGGLHLMLMGVDEPVKPGQNPIITMKLEGGTELAVPFEVKSFTGANESYEPESEHGQDH